MKRYPVKKRKTLTQERLKNLTQSELKELLNYNPMSGLFMWINSGSGRKSNSYAGFKTSNGYRCIKINGKQYRTSRLAFLWMKGYFPEYDVDHKNRIRNDDKWENLRHATQSCNARNRSIHKNNKSGVTGVSWNKQRKSWGSYIRANNKRKYLGNYKNKEDAVQARWNAEVKYGYPNCNTISSAYIYLKEVGCQNRWR
jgi:hypothetical protein